MNDYLVLETKELLEQNILLRPKKMYKAIGLHENSYIVINDNFEPVSYHKDLFKLVDDSAQRNWVISSCDNSQIVSKPLCRINFHNFRLLTVFEARQYVRFCQNNSIRPPYYLNYNFIILRTKNNVRTGDYLNSSVQPNTLYIAISIDESCFRVIDDNNEPILLQKSLFDIVDDSVKASWCQVHYDEEWWIQPFEFTKNWYVFLDFFDGKPSAVKYYIEFCRKNNIPPPEI